MPQENAQNALHKYYSFYLVFGQIEWKNVFTPQLQTYTKYSTEGGLTQARSINYQSGGGVRDGVW